MATLKPFAALRPRPDLAGRICELPYDVMSSDEARALAADNPLSFLHVSKPEIDLPPETDPCAPEVYSTGRRNFQRLIAEGALRREAQPAFYLYRQVMGDHSQVGLVALASCQEYLRDIIKKHELTRPDKEDDRVRHIESLESQTGPVFLTYRAAPALDRWIAQRTGGAPDVDFTAPDGVRHTAWTVADPAAMRQIEQALETIPFLYIADGHHRSAAAARVFLKKQPAATRESIVGGPLSPASCGWFLAVLFPHNQLQILPYNRLLKDLHGLNPRQLLEKLDAVFVIRRPGSAGPARRHELGLYLDGDWITLHFRPKFAAATDPIEQLDVTLLQKYVLDPIFGIDDPRTSKRIQFVGGIRGPGELERRVDSGEGACAFSMFPTRIEDLMTIADAGATMPPKSTWFEPKLRDAMFCHMLT